MACRKGLPRLQRGPYGIATAAPLHSKSGPAVTPGGPYGKKSGAFSGFRKTQKLHSRNAIRPSRGRDGGFRVMVLQSFPAKNGLKTPENGLKRELRWRTFCKAKGLQITSVRKIMEGTCRDVTLWRLPCNDADRKSVPEV